jgi:hypothetical protein
MSNRPTSKAAEFEGLAGRATREGGCEVTVPFKPGDRIRLKANHAIEAVVDSLVVADRFCFWLDGSRVTHVTNRPDEWERVPQPMPTLEPGMVVQTSIGVYVIKDPSNIFWSWGGMPITRVGRVEWIWERDDA